MGLLLFFEYFQKEFFLDLHAEGPLTVKISNCMQIVTNKVITYLEKNSVLFENPGSRRLTEDAVKAKLRRVIYNKIFTQRFGRSYFNNHCNLRFVTIIQVFKENFKRKTPSASYLEYV